MGPIKFVIILPLISAQIELIQNQWVHGKRIIPHHPFFFFLEQPNQTAERRCLPSFFPLLSSFSPFPNTLLTSLSCPTNHKVQSFESSARKLFTSLCCCFFFFFWENDNKLYLLRIHDLLISYPFMYMSAKFDYRYSTLLINGGVSD